MGTLLAEIEAHGTGDKKMRARRKMDRPICGEFRGALRER